MLRPEALLTSRVGRTNGTWWASDFTGATADGNPAQRAGASVFTDSSEPVTVRVHMRSNYHMVLAAKWSAGGLNFSDARVTAAPNMTGAWLEVRVPRSAAGGLDSLSFNWGLADASVAGISKDATHWFTVDRVMISTGDQLGAHYADGDSPGWKWLGAANASESVGYPLPLTMTKPDMSQWYNVVDATNAVVVVNPPANSRVGSVTAFDYGPRPVGLIPTNYGYQEWVVEGWAAAPRTVADSETLSLMGVRVGFVYGNDKPNGYGSDSGSGAVGLVSSFGGGILSPVYYRRWRRFKAAIAFTLATDLTPAWQPNLGRNNWQLAGVVVRRRVGSETSVIANTLDSLEAIMGTPVHRFQAEFARGFDVPAPTDAVITRWEDLAGGRALTLPNGVPAPKMGTKEIIFPSQGYLVNNDIALSGDYTIYAVMSIPDQGAPGIDGSIAGGRSHIIRSGNYNNGNGQMEIGETNIIAMNGKAFTNRGVYSLARTSSRIDGLAQGQTFGVAKTYNPMKGLLVNQWQDYRLMTTLGRYSAVLIYDKAHSITDQQRITAWLEQNYGINTDPAGYGQGAYGAGAYGS